MDLSIIGKFIQERRKAKNLTQIKLAQKIEVSEKTISKWECGYGFPDATLILPLCQALGISANELLSGKLLYEDEYKKTAEQNLIELKAQQEKTDKHLLTLEIVLGYMSTLIFLMLIFFSLYSQVQLYWKIIASVFGLFNFIVGVHFCLKIEKEAGLYQCAYCQHKYIPTYKQVLWSIHTGRTRYMKCPKCAKRSWNKKVIKRD